MNQKKPHILGVSEIEQYAKRNAFVLKGKVIRPTHRHTGRPSVMTQATVQKLEYAFVYDSTVEEACLYAGISRNTYYNFCKQYPEFLDRIKALRHAATFVIRKRVVIAATQDANIGLKYLERKLPLEFGLRGYIYHSGSLAKPVEGKVDPKLKKQLEEIFGKPKYADKTTLPVKQAEPPSLFELNNRSDQVN